jgi:hypothetical protein
LPNWASARISASGIPSSSATSLSVLSCSGMG